MSKIGQKEKNFFKFLLTEYFTWWSISFVALNVYMPHRFLEITGGYYVAFQTYTFLTWFYALFLRREMPNMRKKYGEWALVTGASDGIGAALAIELAGRGFSVILIARTESKLESVAKSCLDRNPQIRVKVIVADFSKADRSCYPLIQKEIQGLEIGLLCNNVGIANEVPQRLHEQSDEFVRQCLEINTFATPTMTRMILPQMIERKRGCILNIGSASATHPTPMLALYSATKAFLTQFTSSIHYEYKDMGIDCISCSPYYVISNLSGITRETYLVCSSNRFAVDTLRQVGYGPRSNPYWVHNVFEWLASIYSKTPERLLIMMEKSRNRNQHKLDKKKE